MTFNCWRYKQTAVCIYLQWSISHKKKQTIDPHNNMDESCIYFAKWKKPVPKGHILYDFFYMAMQKVKLHGERQVTSCQQLGNV